MAQVDSEDSTVAPAGPADALYYPTDISPDELFAELERVRGEAEAEIERLIDLVDRIDSFDEREPDHDDEPSLARTEAGDCLSGGTVVDGEFEFATTAEEERRGKYAAHDLWSDGGEPLLGSCEESPNPLSSFLSSYTSRGSQVGWADGSLDDREGDGCADDREDACEDEGAEHDGREPSLGWTEEEAARGRTCAGTMEGSADLEQGEPARRRQGRTRIDRKVTVDVCFGRFVRGIVPEQKVRMRAAMRGRRSDVRSG